MTSEALQFVFGSEIVKGASKAVSTLRRVKTGVKAASSTSAGGGTISRSNAFLQKISKRVPEIISGQLTEKDFLIYAEKYLGKGYKEVSKGHFLSKDGLRQVRWSR